MSEPTALEQWKAMSHEEVLLLDDAAAGLRVIIAIHDTSLGPAVGGTRMRLYPSVDDAFRDALRLSRAMTYKAALCGMDQGGAKAVILADPAKDKNRAILTAYARILERLGGRFHTGADMGIDSRDVAVLARHTKYVSHTKQGAKVDTAGLAALGVYESIVAASEVIRKDLEGLHVAVQGLGQVGYRLARLLKDGGARLTVADVDPGRVERAVSELGAVGVDAEAIYEVEADVFSPNAMGDVLNGQTVPRLRCQAVVGAANEQLATPEAGDALHARDILYGPDYVVNAGGLLSLLFERGETDEDTITDRVRRIGDRVAEIWHTSSRENVAPHRVADRLAEERLAKARGSARKRWPPQG